MAAALELAQRGRFRVEPNPRVGAVVLDAEGNVVGRGHHAIYGGPHAEVAALADAGDRARGGTLVVTLEPCAHDRPKKTPPCAPAVARSGVAHVVVGAADPDDGTRGRARAVIEAAGVAYGEGVLREDCEALIARYAGHRECDVPWTIAKWASSADGRIADAAGASHWITGETARALVHEFRGSVEAVVVGAGTVATDDPALTCRAPGGRTPLRVVLDSTLRTTPDRKVVTTAGDTPTLILTTAAATAEHRTALEASGVDVEVVAAAGDDRVDVTAAWRALHARGVRRVLLEAGGALTGACARAGLVNQVAAFVAPVVIGGDAAPRPVSGDGWPITSAPRLREPRVTAVGDDALVEGYWS